MDFRASRWQPDLLCLGSRCRQRLRRRRSAYGIRSMLAFGLVFSPYFASGALAAVQVQVGQASGYPGWVVDLPVRLTIDGEAPSSVGLTLFFADPRSVKVEKRENGEPDCTPAAGVETPGRFAFWPVGCFHDDDECDAVRVLFVDLSGTGPNLPGGELFRCKVRIATSAVPGTYPVENRESEAAARGGREVPATGSDGAVAVLQPPGDGGCAVTETGSSLSWYLGFLAVALLLRLGRTGPPAWHARPSGAYRARAMLTLTVGLGLVITARPGWAERVELALEGQWSTEGAEGTWSGEVAVGSDGSISGQVRFDGLHPLPAANVLAVWSRGAIRTGSVFPVGQMVRAGRLRGGVGTAGLEGELTTPDGSRVRWVLRGVRALKEKALPPRATSSLAQGQPAVVVVGIDPYPAVRAARLRSRNLAHFRWDTREAVDAYFAGLEQVRAKLLSAVQGQQGVVVVRALPRVTSVWLRVERLEALAGISALAFVRAVEDPISFRPSLAQSLPRIGQPSALALGLTGRGSDVVILDTGVDHLLSDSGGQLFFWRRMHQWQGCRGLCHSVSSPLRHGSHRPAR